MAACPCCRRRSAGIMHCNAASAPPASSCRSMPSSPPGPIRRARKWRRSSAAVCAGAPDMRRSSLRRSMPRPPCGRRPMLDLGTSFVASVDRDPHAVAIVDGDLRLTYRDWYRAISSVVAGLDAAGLRPGDHLVTLLQNRWEAATLHWACQLAGVIITPINWRAKPEELDFVVENATARAVAFETVSAEAVAGSAACQGLPRIAIGLPPGTEGVAFADLLAQEAPPATPRANAEAWSLMLYTSGTTGKPKGVPRRHRAERAAAVAHVAQNLYSHGECTLGVMPLYHTMGVRSLLAMSLIGGCFVCLPRFDCLGALALIERERVTNLYLVPTLYYDIVHHADFPKRDASSVRKLGF